MCRNTGCVHRLLVIKMVVTSVCYQRLQKWILVLQTANMANQQKGVLMLVLSRQRDESIMIGDDVEITIVDVRGDKVRLGINAPKHIPVHRREIYNAIQREKTKETQPESKKD